MSMSEHELAAERIVDAEYDALMRRAGITVVQPDTCAVAKSASVVKVGCGVVIEVEETGQGFVVLTDGKLHPLGKLPE
jgi:hypothetical protein